jgi:hypothetical protein
LLENLTLRSVRRQKKAEEDRSQDSAVRSGSAEKPSFADFWRYGLGSQGTLVGHERRRGG